MNLRAHFFLASAISLHLVACGSTVPPEESDKTASSGSNGTGSTSSSGTTEGTVPAVAAPDPATGNGNGSTSDTIPAGAYVTGNEVIGRTSGGPAPPSMPGAPANLRIIPPSLQ